MGKRIGIPSRYRRLALAVAAGLVLAVVAGCCRQGGSCPAPTPAFAPAPMAPDAGSGAPIQLWLPVAGRVVVLDPGHGGKDDGASHHDLKEKDINLDLARRTAELLRRRGVDVRLTRDDDAFIPLGERSAFANELPNAIFVSIHVNAVDNSPKATGIETFILSDSHTDEDRGRQAGEKFRMDGIDSAYGRSALADMATGSRSRGAELAQILQRTLVGRLADRDRGVKKANMAVLRETYLCPAVLVETGFVSNPDVAERMRGDEWRRQTAEALEAGIVEYLRRPDTAYVRARP